MIKVFMAEHSQAAVRDNPWHHFLRHIFQEIKVQAFQNLSMESNPNKRVLLVDDEEDFCEIVMRILHKSGYEVICAPTIQIATRVLSNYDPAIVLLDQNLPDGLGLNFLENNKTTLSDKQVIFITGSSSRAIIDKAISLGAFHFLTKPITSDALNKAISQAEKSN